MDFRQEAVLRGQFLSIPAINCILHWDIWHEGCADCVRAIESIIERLTMIKNSLGRS